MEFVTLLSTHASSVPFWMIWLIGIVYALINRDKHPRTSLLAGVGLGILLLDNLLSAVLMAYYQYQAFSEDGSMAQLGINLTTLSICSLPFSILSWLLLLTAIFWRKDDAQNQAINNHAG